jgi:hypothetical protein
MATLKSVMANDIDVFFNSDELAESATLNGVGVDVIVVDGGIENDTRSISDTVTVMFQAADYETVVYKTDTLVIYGQTWRYPKVQSFDGDVKVVLFRSSERPTGWKP